MKEKFYPVKVKEIIDESFDSKSLTFELENGQAELFSYKQGQHVYIKTKVDGMEHFRPYSITSAPYENELKLTIKRYRGGIVSNHINDNVKKGETLDMLPPQGEFHVELDADNNKQYFFIGAGSGISPLLSIIKETLAQEPFSRVYLFYGNRNEDSIIFHKELLNLQKQYPSNFFIELILSAPKKHRKPGLFGFLKSADIKWKGLKGHIDTDNLLQYFKKNKVESKKDMSVFICGPDGMIRSAQEFLLGNGIEQRQIMFESFNREYENILPGGVIDHCKTKVNYKGEQYEVILNDQRPILDSLLKEELIIPFACRSGLCSACMVKVVSGETTSRETKGLTPELKSLGYVLSCQSVPASETLEIDFDTTVPKLL